jgi:hypothetical protein
MGELTTDEAGARFAELICTDPQWLHEEFSALVRASFGAPPPWPRPPAPPRVPPPGLPAGQAVRSEPDTRPVPRGSYSERQMADRQRSPPA